MVGLAEGVLMCLTFQHLTDLSTFTVTRARKHLPPDYLPPESGGGSGCLQALVTVKSRSFVLLSWEINGSDY